MCSKKHGPGLAQTVLLSLPDRALECLTRLEYRGLGCRDLHDLLGAWIAAGAGGPLFDLKGAAAPSRRTSKQSRPW